MATSKQLTINKNDYTNIKQQAIKARSNTQKINETIDISTNLAFIKDANDNEFYLLSPQAMESVMRLAKDLEIDKYLFELEKEIHKNTPIDFDDVWCIAIREVKNYKKDPKVIVKNIKKKYPYLFLNFVNLVKDIEL
ncbi:MULTISPECIES: DUF2603 domain-containing protein [Helicobacter]|uniref:DUF2603 domain-containing protein n=1 Tax=Helicobacter ibis TaxID=2962633 RepID=A0ABT4VET0_9HELI|nr:MULTISPECIES: DUF2603 domain-containing protein [Helicobacter]MDA3966686.1 DUF2603 domain-containing protein [Helicobacter sp. WB40]MDA3968546.1 DUF2603 domain-containing protein [Helicobacter ibis]